MMMMIRVVKKRVERMKRGRNGRRRRRVEESAVVDILGLMDGWLLVGF